MKKTIIGVIVLLISVGIYFVYSILINPKSPRAKTSLQVGKLKIEIHYSSPSKRERLIFGTEDQKPLLTYGKYWRLGANAPTKISINKDVKFAGKDLKSGNYSIYAVPYKDYWDITLNSQINSSGFERPDPSFDVFTVSIPLSSNPNPVEHFVISLKKMNSKVTMTLVWDDVVVAIPILIQ
jgi:hypothetical protein